MPYAELQTATAFAFLRGASHAEELVVMAASLGIAALGVADHNTVAGVVRAHEAAAEERLRLLRRQPPGVRRRHAGPALLSHRSRRLGTADAAALRSGKSRARKGDVHARIFRIMLEFAAGQIVIAVPPDKAG